LRAQKIVFDTGFGIADFSMGRSLIFIFKIADPLHSRPASRNSNHELQIFSFNPNSKLNPMIQEISI